MGFEPCNCILGETKTGICTRLLCCSRTDPSSLARELQLFCWKAQKLSYIESKLSLLTNCVNNEYVVHNLSPWHCAFFRQEQYYTNVFVVCKVDEPLHKLGQVKEISKTKGFVSRKICFQNCIRGSIKQGGKYFKTRSKGPLRSQELDKTAL